MQRLGKAWQVVFIPEKDWEKILDCIYSEERLRRGKWLYLL
jgi:hypothetical protein